ncbi:hypothetical protein ACG33_00845 [Steroidobacter denitrificans]|uniref:FHA domain-containing protein n=1 Tax=Steroidobacter denitrificans TaxID=465721 RepID=A0A127F7U8_STEDE|nr:FHA domain-containing protein [Steroidobacter denitrificans]AMN45675.1 hypothetical protein ACG33_00845 [Steroidobacter denitrificans]
MLCLELIDSELILARLRDDVLERLATAPGIALLGDQATLTGESAARCLRLRPLLAHTNYWRTLSTVPLPRPSQLVRTSADLAFVQAETLLGSYAAAAEQLLLAVPAGYSREQLGLLLGVIGATGIQIAGLVDAALAASSLLPAPARALHLDLELHQAILTVLEYVGGERQGLRRSHYEITPHQGVLALQQTWMRFIAEQFVRKTRFDPLHHAESEQRLVDELPRWLALLADQDRIVLAMQSGERSLEIELEKAQFIAAVQPHYVELRRLVQRARIAGLPVELHLSQRIAGLPGLLQHLEDLRDCTIRVLPPGAAALGALQHASAIIRPADALALVYHLPVFRAADIDDDSPDSSAAGDSTPALLRPTHVLFQGRAWRIAEEPLEIGWSPQTSGRALLLSGSPGVSRLHCTVLRRNGAVLIEDHSTYGSYVNEERVVGKTALTVGDRLRLGTPGITLELIQLVNDDGTPQD